MAKQGPRLSRVRLGKAGCGVAKQGPRLSRVRLGKAGNSVA